MRFDLRLVCFYLFCTGLPDIVRLCFGQPCSPCESGRFRRPSPHSAYTYTPSGASPAVIVSLSKVPPGFGPKQSRALHFWSSSARCSWSRSLSRSLRRRSRRLRGETRRNALSAEYRLLALRRVSPRIRRTASSHVAQFGTRPLVPCLTFRCGAFFFVVSALADVLSARLTAPRIPRSEAESSRASSMRGANPSRRLGRGASPRRQLPRGKSTAISSAP